jgi:hypothetical protein
VDSEKKIGPEGVELTDAQSFSPGFPKAVRHEVLREHLLLTVEKMLLGGLSAVLIEGEEGLGATTLLAQFSRLHFDKTVSCFISVGSRFAYEPSFIRTSIAAQILWLLERKELDERLISEPEYHGLIYRLQRRAQKTAPFFFVIDGLAEIPPEDESIRELILRELLPIGLHELKFVLSAQQAPLSEYFHSSARVKPFPLSPFSPAETAEYMKSLHLSDEEIKQCQRLCMGIPGNLASVRRLLEAGRTLSQIVEAEPEDLPGFLQIEWDRHVGKENSTREILAVVAFGRRSFTAAELAIVLNSSDADVQTHVASCGLLDVVSDNGEIRFITEAHRRFAEKKLGDLKQATINRLIDSLLREGRSREKTSLLPNYYEQAGRYDELLDTLSEDHLSEVVAQTSSITALQRDVSLALHTASRLSSWVRLFKYSLLRSAITEFVSADPWVPEIEAYIALGNFSDALAIANAGPTKELRLRLLAAYARLLNGAGVPVDESLREQVIRLVEDVGMESLGKAAVDIASDLVVIAPDHAIKIIEKLSGSDGISQDLDGAFLRLAIAAVQFQTSPKEESSTTEKAQERIKDESLRKFVNGLSALLGRGGAQETIRRVERMDPVHRAYALRQWLLQNRENADAIDIVEYVLDHMLSDTATTTTLRDLREAAVALPYAAKTDRVRLLVKRFDSQKLTVQDLGSAEEATRLEMLLARAELKYDMEATVRRIESAFEAVQTFPELAIRVDCLAWILSAVTEIKENTSHSLLSSISEQAKSQLGDLLDRLLCDTADQEEIVRGAIRALSRAAFPLAMDIASRLNTEQRRDRAYSLIVRAINETRRLEGKLKELSEAIQKVGDEDAANSLRVLTLETIHDLPPSSIHESELVPFIRESTTIVDAYARAQALLWSIKIATKRWPDKKKLVVEFSDDLLASVEMVDAPWAQAEVFFEATAAVAPSARELAMKFLKRARECKKHQAILGADLSKLYVQTLWLATRALAGTAAKGVISKDHLERLEFLINVNPSMSQRAQIWGDLAARCWRVGARDLANDLVSKHVWPAINAVPQDDRLAHYHTLSAVAPCLYFNSPGATDVLLARLSTWDRDVAYGHICATLITRLPPYEPSEPEIAKRYRLEFPQVLEYCELLKKIRTDTIFYLQLEALVDALTDRAARDWLTRQQKGEIGARLGQLAREKLPDPSNIAHEGYLVTALAQVYKLTQVVPSEWDDLIKRACSIPNLADRVIVIAYVAMALPSKQAGRRQQLLSQAERLANQIPGEFDKAHRFQWLARMTVREEPAASRRFVKAAFQCALALRDEKHAKEQQKQAIELAHRIDPDYANQLARSLDDDPAKRRARAEARERIEFMKTKKILSEAGKVDLRNSEQRKQIPQAAWSSLGALNSGRNEPQRLEQFGEYLMYAASTDLESSYPVFAWIIENANMRYARTDQARDVCTGLVEGALMTASLLQRIMAALTEEDEQQPKRSHALGSDAIVIREGEQEMARKIVTDWIRSKASETVKICDPYFSTESLWLLKVIKNELPGCRVLVLMGGAHIKSDADSVEHKFKDAWRAIADFDPPDTDIVIAAVGDIGKSPIHERWLVSQASGLRLGTSVADLGSDRISEISPLSEADVVARNEEMVQYLKFDKRVQNGERIKYNSFTLP